MIDNKTYIYYGVDGSETHPISTPPTGDCKEWCMVILPIVVGLPALYCLLAMGGVFAYVGPWVMFGVTILFSKRLEKGMSPASLKPKRSVGNIHVSSFNTGKSRGLLSGVTVQSFPGLIVRFHRTSIVAGLWRSR